MATGVIHSMVVLEEPRSVYGGGKPIRGHVRILYSLDTPDNSSPSNDYYAPIQAILTLKGREEAKAWSLSEGESSPMYDLQSQIFFHREILQGQLKVTAKEPLKCNEYLLYFEMNPRFTNDLIVGDDSIGNEEWETKLPPSYQVDASTNTHKFKSSVEYRLGVDIMISEPQVELVKLFKQFEPLVHYEPEETVIKESSRWDWSVDELVSDRLPPLKHWFQWVFNVPAYLYPGRLSRFTVRIKPLRRIDDGTATHPAVLIKSFCIKLYGHWQVKAGCPPDLVVSVCEFNKYISVTNEPSHARPLYIKSFCVRIPRARPEMGMSISSFETNRISKRYSLRLALTYECLDTVRSIEKEYNVVMHPPRIREPPRGPGAELLSYLEQHAP